MAVQAQYPSNVLLFNRSVQEGTNPIANDYSLQPQTGGGASGGGGGGVLSFFDQTNMAYNRGAGINNNSRKRGRELGGVTTAAATGGAAMNRPLISVAPQPQLMDLTQLHTTQRNAVSIGLGLAFGEQQQRQQQLSQHQQQQHHSVSPQSSAQSSVLLSILSDDLAIHIKQQRDEIEHFLLAQGEQLRRTLVEKRQRHYRSLLGAAEESVARRLREKEAEVEKAARRNAELEAKAAQLSLEAQAWQHRAKMQEHMATNLQAQLERAIITSGGAGGGGGYNGAAQGQERDEWGGGNNSAGMVGGEAEDAESAYIDPDRVVEKPGPSCKACRKRVASVVLLPCRHLCLCTECDAVAQACPLCLAVRNSSIEVYLS